LNVPGIHKIAGIGERRDHLGPSFGAWPKVLDWAPGMSCV